MTAAHKAKISASMKGRVANRKGSRPSAETRKKLSVAKKGNKNACKWPKP